MVYFLLCLLSVFYLASKYSVWILLRTKALLNNNQWCCLIMLWKEKKTLFTKSLHVQIIHILCKDCTLNWWDVHESNNWCKDVTGHFLMMNKNCCYLVLGWCLKLKKFFNYVFAYCGICLLLGLRLRFSKVRRFSFFRPSVKY